MTQTMLEACRPGTDIPAGTFNADILTANLSQIMDVYHWQTTTSLSVYTNAKQFLT